VIADTGPAPSDGRDETPTQRHDRNWNELLQELRVIQTGVQLLTGFLLTLPFQQRFGTLSHAEHAVYLLTAGAAIIATALLQTPVMVARALFRRHRRKETVMVAHRFAIAGMAMLAVAIIGVAFLIAASVVGGLVGAVVGGAVAALLLALWLILPLAVRRGTRARDSAEPS
jgi:O-antigen/teichoic acid export membrane protein